MIIKGIDNDKLYFHPCGKDALYVDACLLPWDDVFALSANPAKFGDSSTKIPYGSTERTIPATVSQGKHRRNIFFPGTK